ncbi:hypothetical protein [Brevundimonas sp.]|uniref:hypothetical protein n=1 Tax=Brevundimonas sp. TaxID=1871086 RepID=UPI00289A7403|nr:hypothetical protein [Brevundimonas sp.]
MRRLLGAVTVLGLLAVGPCERREDHARPQSSRDSVVFRHDLTGDVSGEYRPTEATGPAVASLFIGQATAFAAWEAGDRRAPPLILTLNAPEGEVRVLPETYRITDASVRMTGATPEGQVELEARIDQGALATARRNLGDRTVVISGTVQAGGRRSPVALTAWNGD